MSGKTTTTMNRLGTDRSLFHCVCIRQKKNKNNRKGILIHFLTLFQQFFTPSSIPVLFFYLHIQAKIHCLSIAQMS